MSTYFYPTALAPKSPGLLFLTFCSISQCGEKRSSNGLLCIYFYSTFSLPSFEENVRFFSLHNFLLDEKPLSVIVSEGGGILLRVTWLAFSIHETNFKMLICLFCEINIDSFSTLLGKQHIDIPTNGHDFLAAQVSKTGPQDGVAESCFVTAR